MYMDKYNVWMKSEHIDEITKRELESISDDHREIEDRFYKKLEFGTAGLRGIIGAGENRMNRYTVGVTTQGLANFILKWGQDSGDKGVVIAYDSRNMSDVFAKQAALILCANGIKSYLFDSLRPVPVLSYAIRKLECISGIVITASHNPPEYSGYKVYWKEGYQLNPAMAGEISEEINGIYDYSRIKFIDQEEAIEKGVFKYVPDEIDEKYNEAVLSQCLYPKLIEKNGQDLSIVFSPLHGSGNVPVRRALAAAGFTNVFVVKEQEEPDGNFPTVKVPNPEQIEVFDLAKKLAREKQADLIIATDPDADRVGLAYKNIDGEYINLNGNQIGCLIAYYLLSQLEDKGELPENGVIIKSIVSSDLAQIIAESFDISLENTLTGFKYIGEKIEEYSNTKLKKFIFGFEESYGYLIGDHARDKDAIVTSLILCEMALFYKKKNRSLGDVLEHVYSTYGYYTDHIESIQLEGKEGSKKIGQISSFLRKAMPMKWAGMKVSLIEDFLQRKRNIIGERVEEMTLPSSNVIKVYLEDNSWFCIRPSGTEPKIKVYFSIRGDSINMAKERLDAIKEEVMNTINEIANM